MRQFYPDFIGTDQEKMLDIDLYNIKSKLEELNKEDLNEELDDIIKSKYQILYYI